mmetsp:Transcript_23685/g.55252  ORF Transcript_23685/g.55252 Transcript_23685/m.55252 type:complete len:215 (-) Transcript_23685:68-712(-)
MGGSPSCFGGFIVTEVGSAKGGLGTIVRDMPVIFSASADEGSWCCGSVSAVYSDCTASVWCNDGTGFRSPLTPCRACYPQQIDDAFVSLQAGDSSPECVAYAPLKDADAELAIKVLPGIGTLLRGLRVTFAPNESPAHMRSSIGFQDGKVSSIFQDGHVLFEVEESHEQKMCSWSELVPREAFRRQHTNDSQQTNATQDAVTQALSIGEMPFNS